MSSISLCPLRGQPAYAERAAAWFHEKWDVPLEEYRRSIQACIRQKTGVPQWYVVLDENCRIVAGAGVIDNDFHDRPDLSPNVCAVFVEEPYRKQGIARQLLNFIRKDMGDMGVKTLYLVTDHTNFYEKCGWTWHATVHDMQGEEERMYRVSTL